MFSQWRNAVENLAHPGNGSTQKQPSPIQENSRPVYKSRLEERLKAAAFVISDTSNATTPDISARGSPLPPTQPHPLSPKSTPLPDSPLVSPTLEIYAPVPVVPPLNIDTAISSEDVYPEAAVPLPFSPTESTHVEPNPEELPSPSPPEEIVEQHLESVPVPPEPIEPITITEVLPQPEEVNSEGLQERLKLVEQRFADVSKSFKRLQAEKVAADSILREFTPLETIQDADGLRSYLQNIALKAELSKDEIKRLSGQLSRQEERIEELRDTHSLESKSQSDQIEHLRGQMAESEALLKAAQGQTDQAQSNSSKMQTEVDRLQKELEATKGTVREEEEKRSKAISLLKTVRQKLVKAEKDKEDALRDLILLREGAKEAREKEAQDKLKLQQEIETVNRERENALRGLKAQFDKEISSFKIRSEKDMTSLKSQHELEMVTAKGVHTKELQAKNSSVATLEHSINSLTKDKNEYFDQLQMRQAELESARSQLELLEGQKTELEYQMRELEDRLALINEDLVDARRNQDLDAMRSPGTSAEDIAQLVSEVETKYQARVSELRDNIQILEKERSDIETDWDKKLRERIRESEELRALVESSARTKADEDNAVQALRSEIERLKSESDMYKQDIATLNLKATQAVEDLANHERTASSSQGKIEELERQLEEVNSREAQARSNNKTLREELRKVQTSAALLERQRNPGVGHWQSRKDGEPRTSLSSSSDLDSRAISPKPQTSSNQSEEEVNLEYLRNVILQFLEHKEMRPNLVRVLSIILHFTPQETRRVMAKV